MILYAMVIVGKYFDAGKILRIRWSKRELTDRLLVLNELINSISDINLNKYSNTLFEVDQEIQMLLEEHPKQLDLIKANFILKLNSGDSFDVLKQEIEAMLNIYENDGELISFLGDLCESANQYNEALEMYQKSKNLTRDGIVILKATDKINQLSQKLEGVFQNE